MTGSGRTQPDTTGEPLTSVSAGQGLFAHLVAGEGFEPSKLSRRIYSPLPLAARATCRGADGRIATEPPRESNRGRGPRARTPHTPAPTQGETWPTHRS